LITRFLIALFIFAFVVYVLKVLARLRFFINGTMRDVRRLRDQMMEPAAGAGGPEMVRCLACGAFVAAREAVTISSARTRQSFCSNECLQRHVK
jgi:hypothetical protein